MRSLISQIARRFKLGWIILQRKLSYEPKLQNDKLQNDLRFSVDQCYRATELIKKLREEHLKRAVKSELKNGKLVTKSDPEKQRQIEALLDAKADEFKRYAEVLTRIDLSCLQQHVFFERLLNVKVPKLFFDLFCPTAYVPDYHLLVEMLLKGERIYGFNEKGSNKFPVASLSAAQAAMQAHLDNAYRLTFCWYLHSDETLAILATSLKAYARSHNREDDIPRIDSFIIPNLRKLAIEPVL